MTAIARVALSGEAQWQSTALQSTGRRQAAAILPSEPVGFDSFTGIFQPAMGHGGPPVLMLSPIGFEELCSRAFSTSLADALAVAGIASLRFDYPGTGDALDADGAGLDDWRAAAVAAADRLRERTGQDEIAVLGQGLGAAFALDWAADLGRVGAMALLEPPSTGRAYLRGLKAWGAVVASAAGIAAAPDDAEGLSVAGMAVPESRAAAIRQLDPARIDRAPADTVLLLSRPGSRTAIRALTARLPALSVTVEEAEFVGYDALLTDPTSALVPCDTIATVTDWLRRRPTAGLAGLNRRGTRQSSICLEGGAFVERPIRFGTDGRLAGVLCLPVGNGENSRAVIFVNAGRDYHIGWGRSTVLQARALARAGIASLRFDVSGVGDSRTADGFTGEVLYSAQQCDDLRAAIDAMVAEIRCRSVGLVGRCSGAWAAFTVAVDDPRVDQLMLINTLYFLWDASKTLAEVMRFSQRTVGDLGTTFLRRAGLRRLLAGELDVRGAARFLVRQANLRIVRRHAALFGRLTAESRRYGDLHRLFAALARRNVRMRLVYSEGDASLAELRSFMGPRLDRLSRYPNVSKVEIEDADHNMTGRAARDSLRDQIVDAFADRPSRFPMACSVSSANTDREPISDQVEVSQSSKRDVH